MKNEKLVKRFAIYLFYDYIYPMVDGQAAVDTWISSLADEWKGAMQKLRELALQTLPEGFEEILENDMISYVVPHSLYPAGYHCNQKQPLSFISLALRKKYIALYHMGLYTDPWLNSWFMENYKKSCGKKADMGKSCLRLKNPQQIPFDVLQSLFDRITPKDWIKLYEEKVKN